MGSIVVSLVSTCMYTTSDGIVGCNCNLRLISSFFFTLSV
jgi:hypothetical protein